MPLTQGSSKATMRRNREELMHGEMGESRRKAVYTIAKKMGISMEEARAIQASAIAHSVARKNKK